MYYAQRREIKSGLRQAVKNSVAGIASLIPFSGLLRASGQKLFLPFYHIVGDEDTPHIRHLYQQRSSKLFEADLNFLLKYFQPIDLPTLIGIAKGNLPLPAKPVMHLSFDDGLRECAEVVAPILLRKGIPATFFLNSAFLDNRALMFRYKASLCMEALSKMPEAAQKTAINKAKTLFQKGAIENATYSEESAIDAFAQEIASLDFETFLQTQKPYMTTAQVQGLLKTGFSIGSHSIDHPLYADIPLEEQIRQTIVAQDFLRTAFQLDYKVFAFPFSDNGVKRDFFEKIIAEENFDLTFGGAGLKKDVIERNLQRFPMETQGLPSAHRMIATEYLYYLLKLPFGKNLLQRKKL